MARHVPGVLNQRVDLMSRGGTLAGEWYLHLCLAQQLWARFGRPIMDLFASKENALYPLWCSIRAEDNPPLGVEILALKVWPQGTWYPFPPVPLIPLLLQIIKADSLALQ